VGVEQQLDEGDKLLGKRVLVAMRPPGAGCWVLCDVIRYAAGMRLELEVAPVAGTGTIRVRSWMPAAEDGEW